MTNPGIDRQPEQSYWLAPVPGSPVDPPAKDLEATAAKLDARHAAAGLAYRITMRFLFARVPLLAAGTTYYLFLALISMVAFGYGVAALVGSEAVAQWLTDALDSAFPGLLGLDGISAESVRGYGTASSIFGLAALAYSGTGAVNAAAQSLHIIYGAGKDPRNYVLARLRMFVQMIVLGPLILASFVPSLLFTEVTRGFTERLGFERVWEPGLLVLPFALALNFVIVLYILGAFGGIRPARNARIVGALAGAVVIEALKYTSTAVVTWSISKPQYGAFALPIALMLVLFLLSIALYGAASLTAAIAVRSGPAEAGAGTPP